MFSNRLIRGYLVIMVGVLAYLVRRQFAPTTFELQELPLTIATASNLNACLLAPTFGRCSDPLIVVLTAIALVVTVGWGGFIPALLTVVMIPLPLAFYFLFAPTWMVLALLLAIPVTVEFGIRFILPRQPVPEEQEAEDG